MIIDETESSDEEQLGLKLLDSFTFWSKRWIWFNGIIFIIGVAPFAKFFALIGLPSLIPLVIYAMIANFSYAIGYWMESISIRHQFLPALFSSNRLACFWIDTLAWVSLTAFIGYLLLTAPLI